MAISEHETTISRLDKNGAATVGFYRYPIWIATNCKQGYWDREVRELTNGRTQNSYSQIPP